MMKIFTKNRFKFENKIILVGGLEREWLVKYSKFIRMQTLKEDSIGEEIVKQLVVTQ